MRDPRLAKLADILVTYSVSVKKGDLVLIRGPVPAEPLVIEVCRAVVTAGGRPHVRMWPEETEEVLLRCGSAKQLETTDPLVLNEVRTIDAMIAISGGRNSRYLSDCDPKKQALAGQGRRPVLELFMKRMSAKHNPLRWVGTQMPTDSAAQDAEMSTRRFADFVFDAGLLNARNPIAAWKKLATAQQRMCNALSRRRELRFRNGDGTDLRVGVEGRTWINCDGRNNFPDGEVFTAPIEDATEGVVQYRLAAMHGGREVTDVRLEFKSGRVVDCSASKNEEFLIRMLDQDRGARRLGEIALGTNYRIKRHVRNTLFDEKIGGTFHAALGAAYPESGGRNKSALHWDMVCDLRRGGVVEADGKLISRNGRFANPTWPRP